MAERMTLKEAKENLEKFSSSSDLCGNGFCRAVAFESEGFISGYTAHGEKVKKLVEP